MLKRRVVTILKLKVKREQFDVLARDELFDACFEPMLQVYKQRMAEQPIENSTAMKEQFYQELTDGQRALFTFRAYYNHAIQSAAEYYWWSAYFIAQANIWSAIKAGLTYFGDDKLLENIEMTESLLSNRIQPGSPDEFNVKREELDHDKELHSLISDLYDAFVAAAPAAIHLINNKIERHYDDFIVIEE